jgi:hypothetical protein
MRNIINNVLKFKITTLTGMLVIAPQRLRDEGISYFLICENGKEYHITKSKKSLRMMNLVDSNVELTGLIEKNNTIHPRLKVLSFKCIDDFMDGDGLFQLYDEYDFQTHRFDYAI